jgi:hypothetical protein
MSFVDSGRVLEVSPEQLEKLHARLVEFAEGMLDGVLRRSDQRSKGESTRPRT